jgi:hypothetical protein
MAVRPARRKPIVAVVPRSVQFEPDVAAEVDEYRAAKGLTSFSKAVMAMLAERRALLAQGRRIAGS